MLYNMTVPAPATGPTMWCAFHLLVCQNVPTRHVFAMGFAADSFVLYYLFFD